MQHWGRFLFVNFGFPLPIVIPQFVLLVPLRMQYQGAHVHFSHTNTKYLSKNVRRIFTRLFRAVFLNRRVAARYRALVSIIPARDRFSWKLSF
jgi:hypothetical protein